MNDMPMDFPYNVRLGRNFRKLKRKEKLNVCDAQFSNCFVENWGLNRVLLGVIEIVFNQLFFYVTLYPNGISEGFISKGFYYVGWCEGVVSIKLFL